MSTPCRVTFAPNGGTIYKHWDGYPEEMVHVFKGFFDKVEAETKDTRFHDAPYLAAKFVVYLAGEYAQDPSRPLDFLSVGVVKSTSMTGEYAYTVKSHKDNRRPTVTVAVDKVEFLNGSRKATVTAGEEKVLRP